MLSQIQQKLINAIGKEVIVVSSAAIDTDNDKEDTEEDTTEVEE